MNDVVLRIKEAVKKKRIAFFVEADFDWRTGFHSPYYDASVGV